MSMAQSLVFLVALKPEIDSGVSGGFHVCVLDFGFGFGGLHVAPVVLLAFGASLVPLLAL